MRAQVKTTAEPDCRPSLGTWVAVTVAGGGGAQSPSISVFFLLEVCCLLGGSALKSGCLFLFLSFHCAGSLLGPVDFL